MPTTTETSPATVINIGEGVTVATLRRLPRTVIVGFYGDNRESAERVRVALERRGFRALCRLVVQYEGSLDVVLTRALADRIADALIKAIAPGISPIASVPR